MLVSKFSLFFVKPHVETTKELKHFKLLKVSGAYWKGDAKNKMLQRIYGVCYETEEDLEEHLTLLHFFLDFL